MKLPILCTCFSQVVKAIFHSPFARLFLLHVKLSSIDFWTDFSVPWSWVYPHWWIIKMITLRQDKQNYHCGNSRCVLKLFPVSFFSITSCFVCCCRIPFISDTFHGITLQNNARVEGTPSKSGTHDELVRVNGIFDQKQAMKQRWVP